MDMFYYYAGRALRISGLLLLVAVTTLGVAFGVVASVAWLLQGHLLAGVAGLIVTPFVVGSGVAAIEAYAEWAFP